MSVISDIFDEVIIDNMNELIDCASDWMTDRRRERSGINQQEQAWVSESFLQAWGQMYSNAFYAKAKEIEDAGIYERLIEFTINETDNLVPYYYRSPMHGNDWMDVSSRGVRSTLKSAHTYCCQTFGGPWGGEAAPLAAMAMTAALAKVFENYGFYVNVYTEQISPDDDEEWVLSLSWEADTPQDVAEDVE